jgi:hypothetical protein
MTAARWCLHERTFRSVSSKRRTLRTSRQSRGHLGSAADVRRLGAAMTRLRKTNRATGAAERSMVDRNIQNTTRYTALTLQRFKEFFRDRNSSGSRMVRPPFALHRDSRRGNPFILPVCLIARSWQRQNARRLLPVLHGLARHVGPFP